MVLGQALAPPIPLTDHRPPITGHVYDSDNSSIGLRTPLPPLFMT